jgi:hypothetical protein
MLGGRFIRCIPDLIKIQSECPRNGDKSIVTEALAQSRLWGTEKTVDEALVNSLPT